MIVWLLGTVSPSRRDREELSFHPHKIEIQLDIDIVKYNVDIMKRSWGEYRIPKRIDAQKNSQSCVESKQKNNRFDEISPRFANIVDLKKKILVQYWYDNNHNLIRVGIS